MSSANVCRLKYRNRVYIRRFWQVIDVGCIPVSAWRVLKARRGQGAAYFVDVWDSCKFERHVVSGVWLIYSEVAIEQLPWPFGGRAEWLPARKRCHSVRYLPHLIPLYKAWSIFIFAHQMRSWRMEPTPNLTFRVQHSAPHEVWLVSLFQYYFHKRGFLGSVWLSATDERHWVCS